MRIVQLSEDGRVSAVLPERSDDLDPPALEEVVEFSRWTAASRWFCRNDHMNWIRVHTFESIDRNSFKAATYDEYKRLACALDNVIGAIVNAVQRVTMRIMSNENIVSAHDVVWYT